uniref:Uncharacterized protein n=2 Tax=Panagrolaimus sp. JU765 TaxID=591449 RepID=A0AC34QT20_9BILA
MPVKVVFILAVFIWTTLASNHWTFRNKKLLIFPELSLNYKPSSSSINSYDSSHHLDDSKIINEDYIKRQVNMPSNIDDVEKQEPNVQKSQVKSIRHQCYFSPIQCLLTLPEDKMRTIVKTHNGVGMEARTIGPIYKTTSKITGRLRQHEDRRGMIGNKFFRYSPLEQF